MKLAKVVMSLVVAVWAGCADTERPLALDRRDALHTPVGERCRPLPGGSYTVCAAGKGYCYESVCRPACGGEDKQTCGPTERTVRVDPPSRWPCACVPVGTRLAGEGAPDLPIFAAPSPRRDG